MCVFILMIKNPSFWQALPERSGQNYRNLLANVGEKKITLTSFSSWTLFSRETRQCGRGMPLSLVQEEESGLRKKSTLSSGSQRILWLHVTVRLASDWTLYFHTHHPERLSVISCVLHFCCRHVIVSGVWWRTVQDCCQKYKFITLTISLGGF